MFSNLFIKISYFLNKNQNSFDLWFSFIWLAYLICIDFLILKNFFLTVYCNPPWWSEEYSILLDIQRHDVSESIIRNPISSQKEAEMLNTYFERVAHNIAENHARGYAAPAILVPLIFEPLMPAPEIVAPAPEIVAPAPEIVAPAPEIVAPAPEIVAPAPVIVKEMTYAEQLQEFAALKEMFKKLPSYAEVKPEITPEVKIVQKAEFDSIQAQIRELYGTVEKLDKKVLETVKTSAEVKLTRKEAQWQKYFNTLIEKYPGMYRPYAHFIEFLPRGCNVSMEIITSPENLVGDKFFDDPEGKPKLTVTIPKDIITALKNHMKNDAKCGSKTAFQYIQDIELEAFAKLRKNHLKLDAASIRVNFAKCCEDLSSSLAILSKTDATAEDKHMAAFTKKVIAFDYFLTAHQVIMLEHAQFKCRDYSMLSVFIDAYVKELKKLANYK